MSCPARFDPLPGTTPLRKCHSQLLTAEDFRYNPFIVNLLRGIPPMLMKMGILEGGGRGVCYASQTRNGNRRMLTSLQQP